MCARQLAMLKARQLNALLKYAVKKSASFFRSFVQRIERIIRRLAACNTKLDVASNNNNLEQEFDALLRQHVKKYSAATTTACEGFAAEQAGAYLEEALSKTAMTTYEEHLTACASCRHHVIELSRLLPAGTNENLATIPNEPTLGERFFKLFSGWRLGALAGLGVATTALLLFFVSTPNKTSDTMVAVNQAPVIASATPENQTQMTDKIAGNKADNKQPKPAATPAPDLAAGSVPPANAAKPAAPITELPIGGRSKAVIDGAANQAAPLPPIPKPTTGLAAEELKREASRSVNQMQAERPLDLRKNDIRTTKSGEESAKAAPAKSIEDKARVAEVAEIRAQDNITVEKEKDTEKAKKKSAAEGRTRSAAKPAPALIKEINGKNFRLENGVWVDTQYNAGAGLSVVRLIHNSDEYKRVLKDTPGLKPWFILKSVIVVWQGKIYRVDK